ncbi:MAG: B12-binding domain-containing radical SAM protein [Bacteroidetes bacterium]|nr:MAG: B12-binding domain-containing radical SAM protein [Bacteroidota bacterium]
MNIKRAILFTPLFPSRFEGMPIGLLKLGTYLNSAEIETNIIDLTSQSANRLPSNDKLNSIIDDELKEIVNPNETFIGISITSPSLLEGLDLANKIREKIKECVIGIGGVHLRYEKNFLNNPMTSSIDFAYHGNALPYEKIFSYLKGNLDPFNIPNFSFKRDGKITYTYDCVIKDDFLLPNFNLLTEPSIYTYGILKARVESRKVTTAQLSTSYGCHHSCRFCTICNSKPPNIQPFNEMISNFEKLKYQGIDFIFFDDPTFTDDEEHTELLLNALTKIKFNWACQTRIDKVNPKLIETMKKAGCQYIYYGIESGDKIIKEFLNKPLENNLIIENIKSTLQNGITPSLSFIFGVPIENESSRINSYELIKEIDKIGIYNNGISPLISPSFYAVYPGSNAEKDLLSSNTNLDYFNSYSREKIWTSFDDGYGAFHYKDEMYAKLVLDEFNDVINKCKYVKAIT